MMLNFVPLRFANMLAMRGHRAGCKPGSLRAIALIAGGVALAIPNVTRGDLILEGGGLTLVEEGPAAAMAGDPVPTNLATGAIPFASSELGPEIGVAFHAAVNLNDGFYGNGYSWIGGDTGPFATPFAGIDLGATPVSNVQSLAFGRSNVLGGDACGVCTDRHLGLYTLQYTQTPSPSGDLGMSVTDDPLTGWATIGTLNYEASEGAGTNFNNTWQRHRFNFDPVSATGLRLIVPATGIGGGTAIDEIELYDTAGVYVPPPPPPSPIEIVPEAGFSIAWNGNDGDYGDSGVPDNVALASNGATAFTSSDLGPELGIDFHVAANLNDGVYGNSNSWIGGDSNNFAEAFAGIAFGEKIPVSRIAWGRDNQGGFTDRWGGVYSVQYTQVDNVDANTTLTGDPSTGWVAMGTIELTANSVDDGAGGAFTGYLRHEFDVALDGSAVMASGIRLVVPATGIGGGTDIDELEVFAVPEPGVGTLLISGLLALIGFRRRRS